MSYKPGDFLIGVSELISMLLPGAIATFLLQPKLTELTAALSIPLPQDGAAGWTAFALLAYLIGHLIFLVGSLLDRIYDRLRTRLRPRERDTCYNAATEVAGRALGGRFAATNTYKFATALLAVQSETALAEVRQIEADSKFFRSLTVLMAGLAVASLAASRPGIAGLCLGLVVACAWRYAERRWKATRRAFEYLLVLDAAGRVGTSVRELP